MINSRRLARILISAAILCAARSAHAQSNPCDVPSGSGTTFTGSVNQSVTLSVCEVPKTADGSAIVAVQGWTAYLDGVSTSLPLTQGATSTVTGNIVWTGQYILPSTAGQHTLQVTVTGQNASGTMVESPKSNPLSLTVKPAAAPPVAPYLLSAK